jgi:integrase/recombinase XerD
VSDVIALPSPTVNDLTTFGSAADRHRLALAGFLARYRERTREAYAQDLDHFFAWCASHSLQPLDAIRPHLELYLRAMESDGYWRHGRHHDYATATISRRFNTVALFFKYAYRDGLIAKDPAEWVDRPRIDRDSQHRPHLPPLQHGIFMAQAAKSGPTAHALACLLGLRGLRISAAIGLDVDHVTRENGYDCVTFVAKGGKTMTQALPGVAARAVREVIADRTEGPLLLNAWGNRMSRHNADRLLKKIAAAAAIDLHVTPHAMRRSFITTGAHAGIPIEELQAAAGHAQVGTTMLYVRRSKSHDRDAAHRIGSVLAGFGE